MTKEELEKKIKNEETVYIIHKEKAYPLKLDNDFELTETNMIDAILGYVYSINEIFSTKKQAQHYLDHGNITRIEELPFVTWEEFKKGKDIDFKSFNNKYIDMSLNYGNEYINISADYDIYESYEATEENFYKAYDICKKLFLGEKI